MVTVVLIKTDDRGFGLASFVFPCRIKRGDTAGVVDSVEEACLSWLLCMQLSVCITQKGTSCPFCMTPNHRRTWTEWKVNYESPGSRSSVPSSVELLTATLWRKVSGCKQRLSCSYFTFFLFTNLVNVFFIHQKSQAFGEIGFILIRGRNHFYALEK